MDLSDSLLWIACGASLLLLVASAFISGSEIAFFSMSPQDRQTLEDTDDARSKLVLRLLNTPDTEQGARQLLATILVLNNAVNILIILLSTVIMQHGLTSLPPMVGTLLHVFGVTFLIVLFGEVLPKVHANRNPMILAGRMARPLTIAKGILRPIWMPLNAMAEWFSPKGETTPELSVEDLEHAVNVTDSEERTDEENRILSGIVNFGSKDVKQIMRPRTDVTAIPFNMSWPELKATLAESGFSRVPVYEEGLDQVRGILYAKDLLPYRNEEDFEWNNLLRQPFFVPENRMIDDLLRDFQGMKVHLAVVVDEYGGTSGIVTLEDVIEEIVGDISDEFDDEDVFYSRIDEDTVVFQGKTALVDVYRILELDGSAFEAAKGESDTLGGFVVEQLARLPKPGETLEHAGMQLVAEAVDRRRVLQVKVRRLPPGEDHSTSPPKTRNFQARGRNTAGFGALLLACSSMLMACGGPPPVPRPQGYFRIALHDTTYRNVELTCPLGLEVSQSAWVEPVKDFAPDSCWFNLVYPHYKARVHCTYAGDVRLDPVVEDAFQLAYEHEVKADAIQVSKREFESGGMAVKWALAGDAASPIQFLCTNGIDRFVRGALYFEVRPNGDSLAPVVARLDTDLEHLMANLSWK